MSVDGTIAPGEPASRPGVRKINPRDFQLATRTTAREINRQIVLNLVRAYQPLSRADLARRMEVARGSVTPLVNELIATGLLYEAATSRTGPGRRPVLLHVRAHDRLVVAVDVRAGETRLMLADFGGRPVAMETMRTPAGAPELVAEVGARVRRLLDGHAAAGACHGVGVVVPGMVGRGGRAVTAPALGWRGVDLRAPLEAATGLPVHVERDAVACALARLWLERESGDAADSFAHVTVSDGVGAALVVGGRVVSGHRGAAGEFGHIPLTLEGPACLCGSRGCWEAYASNTATVARYLGRELRAAESHAAVRATGTTVEDVAAHARAGCGAARAALEESGRYVGLGLAAVVNALDPARIILAGEIAGAWDLVGATVLATIAERTLARGAVPTPVIPEPPDRQSRLRGAAALVVAPVFAAPTVG